MNNIQLLTNEALDMIRYRPENTNIDRGEAEAKPRSILVFSGRYHIISNASLVNNCFIIKHLEKDIQVSFHLEKIQNLYTSFGTVKHLAETVQT